MVKPRPFLTNAGRIVFLIGISISVAVPPVLAQAGNTPSATAVADGDARLVPISRSTWFRSGQLRMLATDLLARRVTNIVQSDR
jgi:hypothetical protein